MSTTTAPTHIPPTFERRDLDSPAFAAKVTGAAYLGLLICGAVGYMWIRGALHVPDDATKTAANVADREGLARLGVALEVGAALMQALVAVFFFVLFRRVHAVAAGTVAAFGLVGAAALMLASALSVTALNAALDGTNSSAADALLMYDVSDSAWVVGGLFFGLWLLPLGWLVVRSGYMPRPIGWFLLAGGAGYVLSTFVSIAFPDATGAADALLVPSTVGELWMIGYLLIRGVRTDRR